MKDFGSTTPCDALAVHLSVKTLYGLRLSAVTSAGCTATSNVGARSQIHAMRK